MTKPIAANGPRLLLVIDSLAPGGTELSTVALAPRLVASGFNVLVVCLKRIDSPLRSRLRENQVPLAFLPPTGLLQQAKALRQMLRDFRPHLVHSALYASDLRVRLASIGLPPKIVNSLVGTPYAAARYDDPSIRRWRLEAARLLNIATSRLLVDHYHAVSDAVRVSAMSRLHVPPGRVTVVPRGRDPADFPPRNDERRRRMRKSLNLDSEAKVLLHVGRLDFVKGHDTLLLAADRLRPKHSKLALLLVGRPGSASRKVEDLVHQLQLQNVVRLLGHREDVADLMAAADVFAFPSRHEGLPGAVIEAMATATPVVAADLPAVREIVEPDSSALLVPADSAVDLSRAIDRLLLNPSLAEHLGARGREIFLQRYQIDRHVEGMIRLYRRLLPDGDQTDSKPPRGVVLL